MNGPFELQTDFNNDCNWIYAFFVKFKVCRHIQLHRRHSNNPNNLHKNSLFSKRYIIRNEIVMENYKWCFKKQFLSFNKHKYRPQAWQNTKDLSLSFHSCNNISSTSTGTHACGLGLLWSWVVHETFTCSV